MKRPFDNVAVLLGITALIIGTPLGAAPVFDPALQPLGSVSPLTLKNTDISGGSTAYRAWFENGSWQGDLVEYTVSAAGGLTSSVDLSGTSPVNTGSPPANWSANVQFAAAEAANSNYWNNGREIVTSWSVSPSRRPSSVSGLPIMNVPAGTRTNPSGGSTRVPGVAGRSAEQAARTGRRTATRKRARCRVMQNPVPSDEADTASERSLFVQS